MSDGKIIEFPSPKMPADLSSDVLPCNRRCDQCIHFMTGFLGQYCRAWDEDIMSVHEADGCDTFEAM